ncbi:MAG: hypothetical protein CVV41_09470 [Candidatus Riflebacteria bacterium HGW-Riflebacteria-1]|jgi:hypothetical protein|nr:MAG: hypothetical protein CVV41_09470 [Candidatus Riflebacteria bacterium HGW-Riflebacteria-1]
MRRKKGQAIAEMALLFPFFLLVIVGGIIDFGFAFYNSLTLQQIANDSAQWAADNNITVNQEITNYINGRKPGWWSQDTFKITTPEQVALPSGGTVLRIRISYDSPTYTPFYQTMLSGITGAPSIKLAALASYKFPQHVYTKLK